MSSAPIQVSDAAVQAALSGLQKTVANPRPYLQAIGEDIKERTQQRFASATGPDGRPWAPNSQVTLARYIGARGGYGKKGLNKKGHALAASKRPLQGQSGDLARQFHISADDTSVTIANSMVYAAMQQFGGTRARFPKLWGDIPARPFMPITPSGELYPEERELIVAQLARYIEQASHP